ncbi:hypothetical protein B0H11DRAFT_2345210 [Mycena galericulata]|nr:hypothetical protein B0H11DRAFT_2345210 [Mycena galericulata]
MNRAHQTIQRLTHKHAASTSSTSKPALLSLTAKASTTDLVSADHQIMAIHANYLSILEVRRDTSTTARDVSVDELAGVKAELAKLEVTAASNRARLVTLHANAKAVLGEEMHMKLIRGRAMDGKTRPTLPKGMQNVKGAAIREYIRGPEREEAEGSNAPARRAATAAGKRKIYGGGGHADTVPTASEIGSGM